MVKFKVVGANVRTGARMVIEVEAQNRAAAERAAGKADMEVLHVEHIPDNPLEQIDPHTPRPTHRGEFTDESTRGWWVALVIILMLAVAAVWWMWFGA